MAEGRPRTSILVTIKRNRKLQRMLLLVVALLLMAAGILLYVRANLTRGSFGVLDESVLVEIPLDELPENTFYITEGRRYYQRGKMTLVIPSIEVYTPIGESTTWEGLMEMPGLYEFSQLPDEDDVNVSIAGHRDIYDMVFYSLDKVSDGDYAYLLYEGYVFRYLYVDQKVVSPTSWEVILPQGFSCLTLTTCDPIGTSRNRLVARWELADWHELDQYYPFYENTADEQAAAQYQP